MTFFRQRGMSRLFGRSGRYGPVKGVNRSGWRRRRIRWADIMRRFRAWLLGRPWLMRWLDERVQARAEALFREARYDLLTHLPNRAYLLETLEEAVQVGSPFAVLFLDLDGFKPINDTWGHGTGDALLKLAAARLRASVRQTDFVARLGGDEFVIVLKDIEAEQDITSVCRRLMKELEQPFWVEGHVLHVGVSIGIACYPRHASTAQPLLEYADQALYAAKRNGKGRWAWYDPADARRLRQLRQLQRQFEMDWQRQRFEVRFQPVHSLGDGALQAVRLQPWWPQGPEGQQDYTHWQPWLRQSGRRLAMGTWLADMAAWHLAQWQHLPPGFRLWVPLEMALIVEKKADLTSFLMNRLAQRWIVPEQIGWILSVDMLQSLTETQLETVRQLSQVGFQLIVQTGTDTVMLPRAVSSLPVSGWILEADWVVTQLARSDGRWLKAWHALAMTLESPLCLEGILPDSPMWQTWRLRMGAGGGAVKNAACLWQTAPGQTEGMTAQAFHTLLQQHGAETAPAQEVAHSA